MFGNIVLLFGFFCFLLAIPVIMHLPDLSESIFKLKVWRASVFAKEHHENGDVSDWHWQEHRDDLVFWYNWARHHPNDVENKYHELMILNNEGEAVDIVTPENFWNHAVHLGILKIKTNIATHQFVGGVEPMCQI